MAKPLDDEEIYDVVIVGAGMVGGILSKELLAKGHRVLILEVGADQGDDWQTYRAYLDQFYLTLAKTPNSPYPDLPTAPLPSVLDITSVHGTAPDVNGYFVQRGPMPFGSNYLRAYGGTTLHWLGTSLRMLPADFETASRFGQGVDWPIGYQDLRPYYEKAEWEVGVSGEVEEQTPEALGIHVSRPGDGEGYFAKGYHYPMHAIPCSYSDRYVAEGANGTPVATGDEAGAEVVAIKVSNTPQGRNSVPRAPAVPGGTFCVAGVEVAPFQPRGATGSFAFLGQRCEGNSACIPICPIQAKYNAMKTPADARALAVTAAKADAPPSPAKTAVSVADIEKRFRIRTQAIASRVELDADNRVSGIVYKSYLFPGVPQYELRRAQGKVYVLAGGAIENSTLALASGLCPSSQELGRNLMDHPYMMAWGLARAPIGAFRGPGSTAGIECFRDGAFRNRKAAFRLELGNSGWDFAAGAPYSDVSRLVAEDNLFGPELRRKLYHTVQRQVRIGVLVEQMPHASNKVTIDPAFRDAMGEFRPVISYDISEYSRAGLALGHEACMQVFQRLGVQNHTAYNPSDNGYLTHDGKGYTVFGAGHLVGTHRIGLSPRTSVTRTDMRTHDHDNLWMVGCGSMPTAATSNPTMTMAALAFQAAEAIDRAL